MGSPDEVAWPCTQTYFFFFAYSIVYITLSGVQLDVVEERERTSKHAWVQFKPGDRVEISLHAEDRHPDRAHLEVR